MRVTKHRTDSTIPIEELTSRHYIIAISIHNLEYALYREADGSLAWVGLSRGILSKSQTYNNRKYFTIEDAVESVIDREAKVYAFKKILEMVAFISGHRNNVALP